MSPVLQFGQRTIGSDQPVVVIAEVGVNHNGDLELGLRHVREAAAAGADAVKFQTYRSSDVVTSWAPSAEYQRHAVGAITQFAMIRGLELETEALDHLLAESRRLGIVPFSTPFDVGSVETLVRLGVEWMKIPSGEVTNHEIVAAVGATGLPTFVSTGMCTLEEVHTAINVFTRAGGGPFVLLHCVSSYPAPLEQMNLRAIATLEREFGVPVGLSDHTIGRDAGVAAVALGASAIEKHFTVDNHLPGPDHSMSMEPRAFAEMVDVVRRLGSGGLGKGVKAPVAAELPIMGVARRSIVAAVPIVLGDTITRAMLAVKRPAGGLSPDQLNSVVGRRARRDIAPDERIDLDDLD